jgi:UDP:flavonoid glycosyltransferase YjiC (YdhE family)
LTSRARQRNGWVMRILFASLRNTSHFLPLVPFIEASLRRGHEVGVAAPQDLAERVAKTGAEFFPVGHPGDAGLAPLWKRMREASKEEGMQLAIGELFAGVLAKTALPGVLETIERWRPTAIIRESMEFASLIAAEKCGISHMHVAITARSGERLVVPMAVASLDAHRSALGIATDPTGECVYREPALSLIPPSLETPDATVGPVARFRSTRAPAAPLPDWWSGHRGPLVYVTLGTVTGAMEVRRGAFRDPLEAVRDLPARVLLTIGADLPLEALGDVPANVHVERFVPQDDVLPHAAAVLCHGGSGTVIGTLAAGVPMVVMPMLPINRTTPSASRKSARACRFPRERRRRRSSDRP